MCTFIAPPLPRVQLLRVDLSRADPEVVQWVRTPSLYTTIILNNNNNNLTQTLTLAGTNISITLNGQTLAVVKEIATLKVGRKIPLRPSLRCLDTLRSDLKEHHVVQKLAQKMEEWRKNNHNDRPERDAPKTGIRSA